jgi:hypothetical protein
MAAGVGWYILSPATFTVDWCGDDDHDAKIEIVEASSHAVIDNHSAHGSFTIQTGFIPRTKKPGDFVYVKGVADQYRLPYYLLEALIAAWWTTSNFELVCLISRPGKFTIEKGQPLAQMFVVDAEHALYDVSLKDGYPPPLSFHKEQ